MKSSTGRNACKLDTSRLAIGPTLQFFRLLHSMSAVEFEIGLAGSKNRSAVKWETEKLWKGGRGEVSLGLWNNELQLRKWTLC